MPRPKPPATLGSQAWRNRIVGHGEEAPDQLLANPKNWRIHPKAQQDALSGVLDEVGWVQEVIVNKTTGHVVDGHLRVSLAISRQEPTIPVKYVELSPDEEALVLATLDPLAGMAATAKDALEALLADVQPGSDAVTALLEDVARGVGLNGAKEGLTDPDAIPAAEPIAKRGDVWVCGDHRVMCGDSTEAEDVSRLMAGEKAGLCLTDPPYNIAISRNRNLKPITNDNLSDADYLALLERSFGCVAEHTSEADLYVFCGWRALPIMASVLEAYWPLLNCIVWKKQVWGLGNYYRCQHELAVYAGAGRVNGSGHSDVWEMDRSVERLHPTQKPVELMELPLSNSSGRGDLVLDPFLGSGTTMIAAERLGRRCYGMEIEPRYVDVTVKRWEEFTGRKAERE